MITLSITFEKVLTDCGVSPHGIHSDHLHFYMKFWIHSNRFKYSYKYRLFIDLRLIKINTTVNNKYNDNLYQAFNNYLDYT